MLLSRAVHCEPILDFTPEKSRGSLGVDRRLWASEPLTRSMFHTNGIIFSMHLSCIL
ncbi:hypothetical protein KC19_2G004200 [Ceratodon purpureus]|uniref:Uncharacterized protein n=1 Tax=Ceratodon purpureus TaxID=3225 RepID=A0A8T0IR97_CERPU|nr:hypothetical protein KC19_2G004200 [Ceratodon purpureus]